LNDMFANRIFANTVLDSNPPITVFDENDNLLTIENGRFFSWNVANGFYAGKSSSYLIKLDLGQRSNEANGSFRVNSA